MIVPNKVITLADSALGRVPIILAHGPDPHDLVTLFRRVSDRFESIDQFLLTLDVLFVLGKVDVDLDRGVLTYAS